LSNDAKIVEFCTSGRGPPGLLPASRQSGRSGPRLWDFCAITFGDEACMFDTGSTFNDRGYVDFGCVDGRALAAGRATPLESFGLRAIVIGDALRLRAGSRSRLLRWLP
jgi:hypothetical protein